MILHSTHLAINLFKANRKFSVFWSDTNSRCTALVTAQVKGAMYAFLDVHYILHTVDLQNVHQLLQRAETL